MTDQESKNQDIELEAFTITVSYDNESELVVYSPPFPGTLAASFTDPMFTLISSANESPYLGAC
jgi:hypothetical protein